MNANDAINDTPWVHVGEKWEAASEDERKEMGAMVSEYQSFWNGHTDEMRRIDWQNDHIVGENIDVSGNFILVIGKYNTLKVIRVKWDKLIMTGLQFLLFSLEWLCLVTTAIILLGQDLT